MSGRCLMRGEMNIEYEYEKSVCRCFFLEYIIQHKSDRIMKAKRKICKKVVEI